MPLGISNSEAKPLLDTGCYLEACIANHRRPRHFVEWAFQQIILKIRTRSITRQLPASPRCLTVLAKRDPALRSNSCWFTLNADLSRFWLGRSLLPIVYLSLSAEGGFSRPATLPRQENYTRQAFYGTLWKRSPLTFQRRKASESLLTSNCCGSFQYK